MKKLISIILCLCSVFGMFVLPGYAEDAPFYSLTFNADGGEFDNGEETKVFYLHEGDAVSDILPPERTAYEFKGWNKALPEKMPANNLTFSAVWEAIPGADPEDGKIPIEKVELNIYINRVYVDVPLSSCLIEGSVPINSVYSFSETLQKNINGKWTENFVKNYNDEIIGAGKYRWKVKFDVNWDYLNKYKTVPDVTKAYIDGKSYGTLDSDCAVYTNPFEITEKDKRPEPTVIKEIRIDGFGQPKAGKSLPEQTNLSLAENCGYECWFVLLVEFSPKGNEYVIIDDNSVLKPETYYRLALNLNPINGYYVFSSNPKVYVDGKAWKNASVASNYPGVDVNLDFDTYEFQPGIMGFFERFTALVKLLFIYISQLFQTA